MSGGGAEIGVAELKIENDVQGELDLPTPALQQLAWIADRGGEIAWSWVGSPPRSDAHAQALQAARDRVADLICGGYLVEREHVSHALQVNPPLTLKLTDKGRNVVAIHAKRKIVAGAVKSAEGIA